MPKKSKPAHHHQYDYKDPNTLKCTMLGCRERPIILDITDRRLLLAELLRQDLLDLKGKAHTDALQDKRRRQDM